MLIYHKQIRLTYYNNHTCALKMFYSIDLFGVSIHESFFSFFFLCFFFFFLQPCATTISKHFALTLRGKPKTNLDSCKCSLVGFTINSFIQFVYTNLYIHAHGIILQTTISTIIVSSQANIRKDTGVYVLIIYYAHSALALERFFIFLLS